MDANEPSQKTSLTNKGYTSTTDEDVDSDDDSSMDGQDIEYILHLDEGDAAHSRVRVLGSMKAKQHELEAVTDDDLKRIRNSLMGHHFDSFNMRTGSFLPAKILKFEYPTDHNDGDVDISEETKYIMTKHENAKIVLGGVKEMALRLHRVVLDTSSCPDARKLSLVSDIEKKLEAIVTGDFIDNVADRLSPATTSSHRIAIRHLNALLNVSLEISNMLWQRKTAQKNSK